MVENKKPGQEEIYKIEIRKKLGSRYDPVRYEILALTSEDPINLREVVVGLQMSVDYHPEQNLYHVYMREGKHNWPSTKTRIPLDEAEREARKVAVKLGKRFAKARNVSLEDMTKEDELALEIDRLPLRRGRLSLFALSNNRWCGS